MCVFILFHAYIYVTITIYITIYTPIPVYTDGCNSAHYPERGGLRRGVGVYCRAEQGFLHCPHHVLQNIPRTIPNCRVAATTSLGAATTECSSNDFQCQETQYGWHWWVGYEQHHE